MGPDHSSLAQIPVESSGFSKAFYPVLLCVLIPKSCDAFAAKQA
jgi:hypothetical protein